jgi:hypothetical protein
MKSFFLHKVHHLARKQVVTLDPQHFVAVVEIEIDAAAGKVLLQQCDQLPGVRALVYIGFENLYAFLK